MDKNSKIWVAGHRGMVGSAIVRQLEKEGYTNILRRTHSELDLTDQDSVRYFLELERPEYVFLCAAKVGGIKANKDYKADFIWENLMIQSNIIKYSHQYGVKKLLFLGSSCIYPKMAPQPLKEEYLLSGYLEETNDAYAIAKIAGIKMCQSFNSQCGTNFISVMPSNLYGVGDNYHPENSHVFPALIRKFHEAKLNGLDSIEIWGDGSPLREFLFADDLAEASLFLMRGDFDGDLFNIGYGSDLTILELAQLIGSIVYPECSISVRGNVDMNGTPKKLLDVSKINSLGWKAKTSLEEGIRIAYSDFISRHHAS
jgi:GDP-L-fucose synthase